MLEELLQEYLSKIFEWNIDLSALMSFNPIYLIVLGIIVLMLSSISKEVGRFVGFLLIVIGVILLIVK